MKRCPSDAAIDAVLAHAADEPTDAAVRAHVAQCDACLKRHGASFELELWGAALEESPLRRRPRVGLAAAAGVLLLIGAAAIGGWLRPRAAPDAAPPIAARAAAPALRVLELVTRVGSRGPDGAVDRITTQRESDPLVLRVRERSRDHDGLVQTHDCLLPLVGARLQ